MSYLYPCSVSAELRRYQVETDRAGAEYRRDRIRQEWIDERTSELLAGEYAPYLPENIGEALSEMTDGDLKNLSGDVRVENTAAIGLLIMRHFNNYWQKHAGHKAEREWEREHRSSEDGYCD